MANPCLGCGACCATFRVSFYWTETESFLGGTVPAELTEKLNPSCVVMRGTNHPCPRCIALAGEIGVNALCRIYPQRASVCRDVQPAWLNDQPSHQCDKGRARHGLPPLQPGWWIAPDLGAG